MVGQCAVPICAYVGNAQHVHQVFGEFECPFSERLCALQPVGIIGEKFRVVVTNHMRARAGRGQDVPRQTLKGADHVLGHLARVRTQAGIELGLSAAGLSGREVHAYAQPAQNADDGLRSFGVERIDQAGDEELYSTHVLILIPFLGSQI